MAATYGDLENYEKELKLQKKSYDKYCKILGEEHPETLTSLSNLAVAYGDLGNYEKCLELHKESYRKRCKVLGEEHPETLTSLNALAWSYSDLGTMETRWNYMRKCMERNVKYWEKRVQKR